MKLYITCTHARKALGQQISVVSSVEFRCPSSTYFPSGLVPHWVCTRIKGHTGIHAGHVGAPYGKPGPHTVGAIWDDEK